MSLSEPDNRSLTPLERAQRVSQALADAARRARFSTRGRERFNGGGFHARRGNYIFRLAAVIGFWLIVALPTAVSALYFGFIASDQYVSEFKFTVAGAEPAPLDSLGSLSGIPAIAIIQDTQIVVNHLSSRAAVEALENSIGIRAKFADPVIDWLARFDASEPIEQLVKYWSKMVDASIRMPAGIVEVKVRAFSPQDALAISRAALNLSETLINESNDRMNRDAIAAAEGEVDRAVRRLGRSRLVLEIARNDEGILDVQRTAEGFNSLLTESRSSLLKLQQEYNAQLKAVSERAPQMAALRSRIAATQAQITEIESKLTRGVGADLPEMALSRLMTRFSELDLEKQIAERFYAGAIASLETARIKAERKKMYLNAFMQPSLPEESTYPRRALYTFLTFLAGLALWGAMLGMGTLVRNNMA